MVGGYSMVMHPHKTNASGESIRRMNETIVLRKRPIRRYGPFIATEMGDPP
jgi:hypothetical protein